MDGLADIESILTAGLARAEGSLIAVTFAKERQHENVSSVEALVSSAPGYHGSRLGEVVEVQRGVKTVFFYVAGKAAVPRRAFEATVARISADLFPPAASFPPRTGHSSRSIK